MKKLSTVIILFLFSNICGMSIVIQKSKQNQPIHVQGADLALVPYNMSRVDSEYNQSENVQGSLDDYLKFIETGNGFRCDLRGFDIAQAIKEFKDKLINLEEADCSFANLSNINLTGAKLSKGIFKYANFENSNWRFVDALKANFENSNFKNAKFFSVNAENAVFINAKMKNLVIDSEYDKYKYLKKMEKLKKREQSLKLVTLLALTIYSMVKGHNQSKYVQGSQDCYQNFLKSGDGYYCDLRGFDLREAIKKNELINLEGANCSFANLSNVNLAVANLAYGNFKKANFENSIFKHTYAENANFNYANFTGATFIHSNFDGANINDANFSGAKIATQDLKT